MKPINDQEKSTPSLNLTQRIKYVLSWNGHASGQFFDNGTYAGNIRSIIVFFLVIALSGHIDEIGRWLWHQFGDEWIVSPGKEAWHGVVARTMGIFGIVFSLRNMQTIYTKRQKNIPLALEDKSEAQQQEPPQK